MRDLDLGRGLIIQRVKQEREGIWAEGDKGLQALGGPKPVVGQKEGPDVLLAGDRSKSLAAERSRETEIRFVQSSQTSNQVLDSPGLGLGEGRPGVRRRSGTLPSLTGSSAAQPAGEWGEANARAIRAVRQRFGGITKSSTESLSIHMHLTRTLPLSKGHDKQNLLTRLPAAMFVVWPFFGPNHRKNDLSSMNLLGASAGSLE